MLVEVGLPHKQLPAQLALPLRAVDGALRALLQREDVLRGRQRAERRQVVAELGGGGQKVVPQNAARLAGGEGREEKRSGNSFWQRPIRTYIQMPP